MAVKGMLEKFYLTIYFLFSLILVLILSRYSIYLSVLLLFWYIIFICIIQRTVKKIRRGYKTFIDATNSFSGSFDEPIKTTLDIASFQKQEIAYSRFKDCMEKYFSSYHYVGSQETIANAGLEITRMMMVMSFVLLYLFLWLNGNISLLSSLGSGVFVLFIASSGLTTVFSSYIQYVKSKDAIEYIQSKNDFDESVGIQEIKKLKVDSIKSISMNEVSYSYNHDNLLIKNFSLSCIFGNIYGLVGPNGSGKSTLIKLLSGLTKNQKGKIILNSIDEVKDLSNTNIGDFVSLYSTEMNVYQQTVKSNYQFTIFSPSSSIPTSREILFKDKLRLDLEDEYMIAVDGANISQGQKQKLLLLRTLSKVADIYIFDEPTGNLDYESKKGFINCLEYLAKEEQKIVLVISHDNDIINNCDYIYKIGDISI